MTARQTDPVATGASYRDLVVASVSARIGSRLDELAAAGVPLESLGSPEQVADQVAAALPATRHAYDLELGPFYDTAGLTRWLGVSRQALADRVRRGSLLACRTQDGHLVYPAFQFDGSGAIRRGLAPVLKVFAGYDGWLVATWLVTASDVLDGSSAMDWLALGRDKSAVVSLARADAGGWAA
jgi:hypothetical protein